MESKGKIMKRNQNPLSPKTVTFRHLIYCMCLILIVITLCSVSFMHSQQKRDRTEQVSEKSLETIQTWVAQRDDSIENLQSYLYSQFSDNAELAALPTETDPVKRFQEKNLLLEQLKMTVQLNGSAQSVFLCIPQKDDYLYLARYLDDQSTAAEPEQIRNDIIGLIKTEYANQNSLQWTACTINNTPCLLWMIHLGENICGAWIDCNTYVQNCRNLNPMADNISVRLVKNENTICEIQRDTDYTGEPSVLLEVPSQRLKLTVGMQMYSDSFLSEEQIRFDYVWFVATILLIILIIVIAFQAFMYYPIQRLTQEVVALQKTENMLPIHEDYRTREIRNLSQYLNQNMNRLKEMKITCIKTLLI